MPADPGPPRRSGRFRLADSLAVRVIALSSLWVVAAFLVVAGLISNLYASTAQRGFEAVVRAQLYNLINAVTVDETGRLVGSPDLGDLSYSQPLSGWYWEVLPAGDNTSGRLASFSLGPARIEAPTSEAAPFDAQYRRDYRADGLDGERVYVEEAEVVLDVDNHAARFRVMGNASIVDGDVSGFNRRLALYLGLFGLGSIVVNAAAILFGLHPLIAVRRSLADVRAGRSERLAGAFPAEIRPLAVEMNALLDSNRRIVERARTQVGNLAHSLKTPIAVLLNESSLIGGEKGRLVAEQSEGMRRQVQHYLDRARVSALGGVAGTRTPLVPLLKRLLRVLAKLDPDRHVDLEGPSTDAELVFAGEREDLEELVGNLLENAMKYGRTRVRLSYRALDAHRFEIAVEDDGPGLTPDEIAQAMRRGARLDEAVAGSGLGLSIVADTVLQYRGDFRLSRSEFGGLKAVMILPRGEDAAIS